MVFIASINMGRPDLKIGRSILWFWSLDCISRESEVNTILVCIYFSLV